MLRVHKTDDSLMLRGTGSVRCLGGTTPCTTIFLVFSSGGGERSVG